MCASSDPCRSLSVQPRVAEMTGKMINFHSFSLLRGKRLMLTLGLLSILIGVLLKTARITFGVRMVY